MAAPTETYVDPSGAASSGSGTIGDPYLDLQYALDTMTRDSTNGDRINVLAGTDEVLGAALDFSTYGVATADAPLIIQGYTSTAGDGGIGGISGAGSYSIVSGFAYDYLSFIDMHLHNTGANDVLAADQVCFYINCEIDNSTADGINLRYGSHAIGCYIHNIGDVGIRISATAGFVIGCTFENGTNDFSDAILSSADDARILSNIFDLDGSSDAIDVADSLRCVISGNSIFSSSGTGAGVRLTSGSYQCTVINNIIEGFSGAGGVGLSIASGAKASIAGFNAFYNNTTDESIGGDVFLDLGNDQSLGASPFTNAGSDDFTVGTTVRALAYPTANYPGLSVRTYLDIGALQRQEAAAGGGLLIHPGMSAGMRG